MINRCNTSQKVANYLEEEERLDDVDKDEDVDTDVDVDTLKWQSHHACIRDLLW